MPEHDPIQPDPPELTPGTTRNLPPPSPAGDPKPSGTPLEASRKRDHLSTHESRQDFKHLPDPKPLDPVKPRADGKQGGKPMPGTLPKPAPGKKS